MLYKFALCDMVPLNINNDESGKFVRTAAGKILIEPNSEKAKVVEAEIKKHPTALFFRAKAIKANEPNSNGDYFSIDELVKSYKSFEGVPFFTNHNNQNVENARGKVIFAEWIPEEQAVYTISFIDREAFPHICRSIEEEYITGVSMGSMHGEANILMADGSLKQIKDIRAGEFVISAFGNKCKVAKVYNANLHSPMYKLNINEYDNDNLFSYDHPVYCITKEDYKSNKKTPKFVEILNIQAGDYVLIPLSYIPKENRLRINISDNSNSFVVKDKGQIFLALSVNSVEKIDFDKDSYDLKVEDDECYIADGLSVHNCSVEYSTCNICGNKAEKTDDYCFVAGTPITMENGSVKNIEDIVVGDKVIDAFGEKTTVTKCFVHEVSDELLSVTSKAIDGELICTKNHPFLAERRNEFTFIPCEYLDEKETLFSPVIKYMESEELFDVLGKYNVEKTEENKLKLSKLIGYYIAEGSLIHNNRKEDIGFAIALGSEEKNLIEDVQNIIVSLFGKNPEVVDRNNYNHKSTELRIYHPMAVEVVKNACIGKANDKTLGLSLMSVPPKYLQEILAGYIDGDGYSDKLGRMILTTASRNLAYQLINILIKLGIPPSIYSYLQNGGPNNREDISYRIYRISMGAVSSLLFDNSSHKCQKSKIIANNIKGISKNKKSFEKLGFAKHSSYSVESVQYSGSVYNFETESHSYVANNTSVHNCTHIRERKGRTFTGKARNVVTGETKEFKNEPVFEYNYGIKFIELSAVVDPACQSCRIQGLIKNDDLLKKVANIENTVFMYRTAALQKQAGKQEVDQLNTVLKTLEDIAVQLIKNRQQVEVEFASDLVNILSELQTFVDELVGAGFGSVQSQGVPGTAETPPGAAELPPAGLSPQITETAAPSPASGGAPVTTPAPAPAAGTVSGAPGAPLAQKPQLPITAPLKPRANDAEKLQKIASVISNLENLRDKINTIGDADMSKRRTADSKLESKQVVTKVLSTLWQEKQDFFEYINKVPSIQDNENRLSVKKRDDSFIVVAENKNDDNHQMVWTYEDLNDAEKALIKGSPKDAAQYFMETFANNLKLNIKEGDTVMSNQKEAGAKSVNKAPEVITEAQLEQSGLYHSRTDDEKNVITEKQIAEKRTDSEKNVVTEAQLAEKGNKLNPRTEEKVDVVTEAQLAGKTGVSPRKDDAPNVITQSQLDPNRTGTEKDVITERQLDSVDAPWERAAQRDPNMFKSAGDHMRSVVSAIADTAIATGCTPAEACKVAASLIGSTKDRVDFSKAILSESKDEGIDYSKRLAYWSKKNIKVAGVGTKEIAESIVSGLRKLASDVTINPEVVIDALDVVSEGTDGADAVSKKIDEKLAEAAKVTIQASKKEELRKALKGAITVEAEASKETKVASADDKKAAREAERIILAKAIEKSEKRPDHVVETSFQELGVNKTDSNFKSALKSFTRGALASQNMKLASITNVTISGDTISIAVQTDEGEESVEIPVGETETPAEGETLPEGDLTGEGLEGTVGSAPAPAPAPAATPAAAPAAGLPTGYASKKQTLKKEAQVPAGGGVPGTPAGVAGGPGAPEQNIPGAAPTDQPPVQNLTTDTPEDMPDEIPTAGEQQPPWALCPECGSSDVDVEEEGGAINKGKCNACGAEYEALVKKEIEFKIVKPTRSVGKDETTGAPEAPEVPALPVAAQTKLNGDVLKRIASNREKNGHVCPACGMKQCKASKEEGGHTEFTCPACNTAVEKDIIVNVNKPDENYLRVAWDLIPKLEGCSGCVESAKKFASLLKVEGMIKQASNGASKFPKANCMELIAKKYGGNSVATFGPCKGKPLADCVCGTLEKLGSLTKVRHLEKLASVSMQKDPMDECIEEHMQEKKLERKEAEMACKCMKKTFATKEDDNIFIQAFAEDIISGKEKILTAQDLDTINDLMTTPEEKHEAVEEDPDIADLAIPQETAAPVSEEKVTIEVPKEVAQELAAAAEQAVEAIEIEVETEPEVTEVSEVPSDVKSSDTASSDAVSSGVASSDTKSSDIKSDTTEEKDMAIANMQVHKILRIGEEVVKIAATPKKVDNIEGNVEAKVPRKDQKLGEEAKADSLMNKELKKPDVPRKDAYMGKEKEADSLINKELKLPDVAVDSSFMGKNEKSNQSGMPAINNEIKGTVIAKEDKTVKEAKKMQEIDTVEKEVEAKVPRNESKLGEEAKADSLINEKNKGPEVPRKDAYLGEEAKADSLINKKLEGPDVPIDGAYMGDEKNVQKDMPGISDKMLKQVKQQKEVQLERIAYARRMKAVEVTAKLLATKRITEGAYENVIEALSKFEIDKIASVADNMYPMKKQASETPQGHSVPAIVMESKEQVHENPVDSMTKKLASHFTIGNKSFDHDLTMYGEK